ncbi:lipoprotein-anchoring transpeptidase ErfK/SrfK [Bradyrhizobium sp. i1.4.4]
MRRCAQRRRDLRNRICRSGEGCARAALPLLPAAAADGRAAALPALSGDALPGRAVRGSGCGRDAGALPPPDRLLYATREAPGTIIIDTPNTYLYYVLGNGQAVRYGIGVGRDGFTWSGVQSVTKKAEWPDWTPPPEMIARQPYLPRHMAGGPGNPLGARAMYLGGTIYRIHGTNAPDTIGKHVSSGCIRLTNDDVTDLYSRVNVGTKVIVLPMTERRADLGAATR